MGPSAGPALASAGLVSAAPVVAEAFKVGTPKPTKGAEFPRALLTACTDGARVVRADQPAPARLQATVTGAAPLPPVVSQPHRLEVKETNLSGPRPKGFRMFVLCKKCPRRRERRTPGQRCGQWPAPASRSGLPCRDRAVCGNGRRDSGTPGQRRGIQSGPEPSPGFGGHACRRGQPARRMHGIPSDPGTSFRVFNGSAAVVPEQLDTPGDGRWEQSMETR